MITRVLPPDLETFLIGHLRTTLRGLGEDVQVGNKEPSTLKLPLTRPLIVVRDDGGPQETRTTFRRSLGVSVLAGTRINDKPARDLARIVYSLLSDEALVVMPDSKIAAIDAGGFNGPYAVADSLDVSRQYVTAGYVAVGSWA